MRMVVAGTHRTARRPGKALVSNFRQDLYKENPNMKKLSHLTMLLAAFLALTSFALAQHKSSQRDRRTRTSSSRLFAMPPAVPGCQQRHRGWIQSCPRLRKRLRPWSHGHPLRQCQSAERTH